MTLSQYVLGFVFSLDDKEVLLLKKRPTDRFNANRWNGVGGKVEPQETRQEAMSREAQEETGLEIPAEAWQECGELSDGKTFHIHVFAGYADLALAQSITDEPVARFTRDQVKTLPLASDVDAMLAPWLGRLL